MLKLKVKKLHPDATIPSYAHPGDAGMDLFSCMDYILKPGEIKLISTGISVEFPFGYELQIRPRSGLALKRGVSIVNTPGTIDAGYRGEIGVIMINHGKEDFAINKRDRIAQGILSRLECVKIEEVSELSDTKRSSGGFGSTGN